MSNVLIDAKVREFNRLRAELAEAASLDPEDQAVIDTAQGETDLDGLLVWMVRSARQRLADAKACEDVAKAIVERKRRHEAAAERLRGLVAEAMLSTGLNKLAPGDFTATARWTKPGVEVIEEELVPDQFVKMIRWIDLAALRAELARCATYDEGFEVPGVAVVRGRPFLTVRT